MDDREQQRKVRHRLAVLRHAGDAAERRSTRHRVNLLSVSRALK